MHVTKQQLVKSWSNNFNRNFFPDDENSTQAEYFGNSVTWCLKSKSPNFTEMAPSGLIFEPLQ